MSGWVAPRTKRRKRRRLMCTRMYLQALFQLSPLGKLFDYYICLGALALQALALQSYQVMSLPCPANSVLVDSAGLVQVGEPTRGLQLLTSATRCLTVHTVTAPFNRYRGFGSTSPISIQRSSWKKQVMLFHLLLRHRWSHCMSRENRKVHLVYVDMQTVLSCLVLHCNFYLCCSNVCCPVQTS